MLHEQAEEELLETGATRLKELLGVDWDVEPDSGRAGRQDAGADAVFVIRGPSDAETTTVWVQVKQYLSPASAQLLAAYKLPHHGSEPSPSLVVAPFLSPRARQVLTEGGIGYLDFTGNVDFRLRRPPIVLHTTGADRNPEPAEETVTRRLSGASAGRLVRYLADVAPPYTPAELATATGLSLAYVSRLLTVIEEQALLSRVPRGRKIVDVDWAGLLRARAADTTLLRRGKWVALVSQRGIPAVLDRIGERQELADQLVVTGSVAATAIAPVAVGGQLILFTRGRPFDVVLNRQLGIMPIHRRGQAGDVLLVEAPDQVVFERARLVAGVPHVALSQLVLDCLSGPGRMPAEGEAVLQFMVEHEPEWRVPDRETGSGSTVGRR